MNPMGSESAGPSSSSNAHTAEKGFQRFPDYILVGQINLHKSQECAATLAKHIDKQWDFFRINRNGIISTAQLELNRDPTKYGAHKEGKPLSVTEWRKIEKDKLIEQRRQLAQEELIASSTSNSTRGKGISSSRSRRGSRSRGRRSGNGASRGRSRGKRGSSVGAAPQPNADNINTVGPPPRGRGRRGSRGRSHRGSRNLRPTRGNRGNMVTGASN